MHIHFVKLPTPDGTWTFLRRRWRRANYFRTYSEAERLAPLNSTVQWLALACGERGRESLGISCSLLVCCFAYDQSVGARADMLEMEQNEFGPKPVLACPLPVFGVTAFATKWGSSASHKSPCRRTARDERVSLKG